jgi:hypothetical protein
VHVKVFESVYNMLYTKSSVLLYMIIKFSNDVCCAKKERVYCMATSVANDDVNNHLYEEHIQRVKF